MNGYHNNNVYGQHDSMSAMMWDGMQDKQMVASYNAMLQRAADFYNSLESSDVTSPSSGSSSPGPPSRSRTSNVIAELKNSIPDKIERRREQNRQSQRAYRDRKEKHQRDLEGQIAQWKDKHRKLSDSYSAQTGEIQRLKSQIDELNNQIMSLQTGMPMMWGSIAESPSEFDLVPFYGSRTRESVG